MGFGLATDTPRSGQGIVVNDIIRIDDDAVHALLPPWLEASGVTMLSPDSTIAFEKSSPVVVSDQRRLPVRQIVLADDPMIAEHLPRESWPGLLAAIECSATLTSATRTQPRGATEFLDRGVTLMPRGGGILVAADGGESVDKRLGSALADHLPLVRLATRRYHKFVTSDGAPLIGWLKAPKLFIATGMGSAAAFFAPALARVLINSVAGEEKTWFAARDPARVATRTKISDLGARAA
jgi:glycine/D-amino acid oxidase-like deaminating enzyme